MLAARKFDIYGRIKEHSFIYVLSYSSSVQVIREGGKAIHTYIRNNGWLNKQFLRVADVPEYLAS